MITDVAAFMPVGTPVEQTAAVLHELGNYLATVPEVTDYQAYAGTAAPINFNGLVRQYYLRAGGDVGDMGMVNSYFTPERTRALLAGRAEGVGNVLAASLGVVTPFCSCSAVPLFIGFVQAGVPLGITFSFLIAAPMVNEVALALLLGLFGWKIAGLYLGLGLTIAIVSGWVIGRLHMEAYLEDWVRNMPRLKIAFGANAVTLAERVQAGFGAVREIVGRVWPYVVAGIAIGAAIHGYVPEDFMPQLLKRCISNLIDNAVLYGKCAEIRVEEGADMLTIRVRDHGPGIPESEINKVFEPFYRLEGSRSRDTGGTGLGLSIARNIAQAHGGDVRLRNHEGGGLEAILALPWRGYEASVSDEVFGMGTPRLRSPAP